MHSIFYAGQSQLATELNRPTSTKCELYGWKQMESVVCVVCSKKWETCTHRARTDGQYKKYVYEY